MKKILDATCGGRSITRILIDEVNGWKITTVISSTYEAKKDGETVTLEAGSIRDILELVTIREGKKGGKDRGE